jgi:hypothetical protein
MTAWQAALVPFSALTLLLTTAVALLPVLLADRPVPRLPPSTSSSSRENATTPLVVIRTAQARWLVNGIPVSTRELERQLRSGGQRLAIQFLPSPALPVGEVRRWWLWLGQRSGGPVALALGSEP